METVVEIPDMRKHIANLETHGFTQIENLISRDKISCYNACYWEWLRNFDNRINMHLPETWKSEIWPPTTHGFLQQFNFGHADFFWSLRCEVEIFSVFCALFKCDPRELLVSFDGGLATLPRLGPKSRPNLKLEQTEEFEGFKTYQAMLSLSDTDGGINFLGESHLYHSDFVSDTGPLKSGLYNIRPQDLEFYTKMGCTEVEVPNKPGSLTIWDSRSVYRVKAPSRNMPLLGLFVSYFPCKHLPEKLLKPVLEKRTARFKEKRMTTYRHWPLKLHPRKLTAYTKDRIVEDQPVIEDSNVTPFMHSLIGTI